MNYFDVLLKTYSFQSSIVGICGIDILMPKPSFFAKMFHVIFLLKSMDPGKLSLTGYGESMQYWYKHKDKFYTEFLSGCNMSFKKDVISDLQPVSWLNNYSIGEDVYLSFKAGLSGKLLVNPLLKVKHHQSKVSRDKMSHVAFYDILNHHLFLKIRNKTKLAYILHSWTILGILLKTFCMLNFAQLKGYLHGIFYLLKQEKIHS